MQTKSDVIAFALNSVHSAFDMQHEYRSLADSVQAYRENIRDTLNDEGLSEFEDAAWQAYDAEVTRRMPSTTDEPGKLITETAKRLTGPSWRDARGLHRVTFSRLDTAVYGPESVDVWRMAHTVDGEIYLVVDMKPITGGICDTATGALWALRGIVAREMRADMRPQSW